MNNSHNKAQAEASRKEAIEWGNRAKRALDDAGPIIDKMEQEMTEAMISSPTTTPEEMEAMLECRRMVKTIRTFRDTLRSAVINGKRAAEINERKAENSRT